VSVQLKISVLNTKQFCSCGVQPSHVGNGYTVGNCLYWVQYQQNKLSHRLNYLMDVTINFKLINMKMLWLAVFLTIWKINFALNSYLSNRIRLGGKKGISDFWLKLIARLIFCACYSIKLSSENIFSTGLRSSQQSHKYTSSWYWWAKIIAGTCCWVVAFCLSRDSWGSECPQTSKSTYMYEEEHVNKRTDGAKWAVG